LTPRPLPVVLFVGDAYSMKKSQKGKKPIVVTRQRASEPTGLPTNLKSPPLIEAVFEIRFESAREAAGDVLPGLLYGKLQPTYTRIEQLPAGSIPRAQRDQNNDLRYLPHIAIHGSADSVLIGDHVISISRTLPTGWTSFRPQCETVLKAVHETGLVKAVQKMAFKCVNILPLNDREPLSLLNGRVSLADYAINKDGMRFRGEISLEGFVMILELASVAEATVQGSRRSGLLVTIDSTKTISDSLFWASLTPNLEEAHRVVKEMFFRLIDPAVLQEYGPQWKTQ